MYISLIDVIRGKVRARPSEMINQQMKTGDLEILMDELHVLNMSEVPPFDIREEEKQVSAKLDLSYELIFHYWKANEPLRLKYRYLDLRTQKLQRNIRLRSDLYKIIRDYFHEKNFTEIETPILFKATVESGAKEFLVPTRLFF
jgi:aspartyl-tRNA synthetase